MKSLALSAFLLVAFAGDVLVLVVPKSPIIKCPASCSSARDCFFVHPLSDQHFYSCFHGKAMVHQCPTGKSFSDDKHQCVMRGGAEAADLTGLSSAKIDELTEKITAFEHLVEKFQMKMEKVQKVIIESDNKIGLLGKFLLKALKSNREMYCAKGAAADGGKLGANIQQGPASAAAAASSEIKPQELMIDDSMMDGGGRGDEEYGIALGGMQSPKSSPQVGDSGLHHPLHHQQQHDHPLIDDGTGHGFGGPVFGPKTGADDDEVEMPVVGGQKQQQPLQQQSEVAIEEAEAKKEKDEQKSEANEEQGKTR